MWGNCKIDMARLLDYYRKEIVPKLKAKWGMKNSLALPRIEKITINVGFNKRKSTPEMVQEVLKELSQITGQRPVLTFAKRAIAGFNIRKGDTVGCMVTLRRNRMYEFLDRLLNVALPRVRDFRGLSPNSFDGRGNYTLGMSEQVIFPEIDYNKVKQTYGMNITITTTAGDNEKARELLRLFGVPFKKEN